MKRSLLLLALAAPSVALAAVPRALAPLHCQVPCGIYGDRMRIDMLMEDAATIEKAMASIGELGAAGDKNYNQIVRWVTTKEEHAQHVQDVVAQYWLAQRIKAPAEGDDAARDKYHRQLALLHRITVAAMKCKQTTDAANVADLRSAALEFSETYFDAEALKHIHEHHGGGSDR